MALSYMRDCAVKKNARRHYSFSSPMKTYLHHGLNLAVIRYRLLEWMANLGRRVRYK